MAEAGDLATLVGRLADPDEAMRLEAAHALHRCASDRALAARAVAPLVELAALTVTIDRPLILEQLLLCLAGEVSPIRDAAPLDAAALRVAEKVVPMCRGLVVWNNDPRVRGRAALVLGVLPGFAGAYNIAATLRDRLGQQEDPIARAAFAFALSRLLPPDDDFLARTFAGDRHDIVRAIAAMTCVHRGAGTAEMACALAGWTVDDLHRDYLALPFYADSHAGDCAQLLRAASHELQRAALPVLCQRIAAADDSQVIVGLDTALALAFGDRGLAHDILSVGERAVCEAMLANPELWSFVGVAMILDAHGLPATRDELAARLRNPR